MNDFPSTDHYLIKSPIIPRKQRLEDIFPAKDPYWHYGIRREVRPESNYLLRRAVLHCACFFRREFRYDFVQFAIKDADPYRAFIWVDNEYDCRVIGSCCFRWREYSDAPHGYGMQWIWFHPYFRGAGLLTKAWPYFLARFEDFHLEGPFSRAMERFLVKHLDTLHPRQREIVETLKDRI